MQSVTINFAGSIDTKTDPKQVSPSNFIALNNSIFTVGGRLTKRNGFPSLGTLINAVYPAPLLYPAFQINTPIGNARKIFSYENELCLNDAFNLFSYDQASDKWNYKGRSTMVSLSTANIAQDVNTKFNMDCSIDTQSGIKVFAWEEANSIVKYSIQDTATGQFIANKINFDEFALFGANYTRPRCLSIAGKSWIFAINNSDGKLYYISIVGPNVPSFFPTVFITDLNTSESYYDIDVSAGNIYLAHYTSGAAIKISILSSSLVVGATITKSEIAPNGLSFFGDGTNIWIVYNNGSATKAFVVNNAVTVTVAAPTVLDGGATALVCLNVTGVWSSTNGIANVFYDQNNSGAGLRTNVVSVLLSGSTLTATNIQALMFGVNIVSKAWAISGIPHITTIFSDQLTSNTYGIQSTYFVLNYYNLSSSMTVTVDFGDVAGNLAVKISPDAAPTVNATNGTSATTPGLLCGVHNPSGSIWELALGNATNISETNTGVPNAPGGIFSAAGVIDTQLDFGLSNPDTQVLANNAHIASGQLTMYDAANVIEQNFHIYPEGITAVISNSGGNMGSASADTLYGYIVTYEWIDNQGQIHRSFPSPVLSPLASGHSYTFASGTTTGKVTLTIPTLRVTNKSGSQVTINIYRTIGNGSVYYLTPSGFSSILNNPQESTVTFMDTQSDALLIESLQIYTTGELGDFAPPAPRALSVFKNRLLLTSAESGYDFYYSKQALTNFPVEFVPSFIQNVGTVAGAITTIAGMDDKIILFKSGLFTGPSILYMVGTGPAASGANNDFTDPLPVAVDCGCVDRGSVVLTPTGLMFKSDKGIYLLDRNLQASYLGAAVEGYNQFNVISAQLIPNTTQVRFLLSNGIYLMYDYFYKHWATFSPPAGISDCIFQGQHTYVDASGIVYKEAPATYYDGINTPVLMSFTSAPFNLTNISGYERFIDFLFLANYISPHQLALSVAYDYQAPSQFQTITPNPLNIYQWRVHAKRQLCQSFQLALQEIYTGTLGASFSMSGFTLNYEGQGRVKPIPGASATGFT